jgi:hypothetical protein
MATYAAQPVRRNTEDYFFLAMALLLLAAVLIGFARTYYLAGLFRAELPSMVVHIHGALFSLWVLLLIAQVGLVCTGHVKWHMKLRMIGVVVAGLMVVAGLATLFGALRRHAEFHLSADIVFTGNLMQLLAFAALVAWAAWARRDSPTHKRLMILATVAIIGPALVRWPFAFASSIPGLVGLLYVVPILLVAFDLWTLRRVHRATICGTLAIVLIQFGAFGLGQTPLMHRLTNWVQNF